MSAKNSWKTLLLSLTSASLLALISQSALAESQIIKLDAKKNTQENPIQRYLRAGTYQITPVGRHHGGDQAAWSVWGHTTCNHPTGCARTVPTTFTGLHNNYYVVSDQLGDVKVQGKPLTPVTETPKYRMHSYYLVDGQQRAYEITQPRVYANEASALAEALSSTFVMTHNGRIQFALLDKSRITDNRGGMSLKITKIDTE